MNKLNEKVEDGSKLKFKSDSKTIEKIKLTLLTGAAFVTELDLYMRDMLRKGKPSLYNDVCALMFKPDPTCDDRSIYVSDPLDFKKNEVTTIVLDMITTYINNSG